MAQISATTGQAPAVNQAFKVERFPNGVTLLGEEMQDVASAAFTMLVPTGAATDPVELLGTANILSEYFNKGAAGWDAQQLSEQFENLGIHRSHTAGIEVTLFSAAMLSANLSRALELYSHVLLEPSFPEPELESVRQLALQDLESLEDEPASKAMTVLAEQFYPEPFGRCQLGTEAGLQAVTQANLLDYYQSCFRKQELIIGVAGKFDWDSVCQTVRRCFSGWAGTQKRLPVEPLRSADRVHHVQRDTAQVQIALAYPSVSFTDPLYYAAKVALGVLSGGMAGRLFVEVREKRGLVYRVSASHSAARQRAAIFASAGTTPENSKETLRVMLGELEGVGSGLTEEELNRAKADLKSKVILRSESTSARASSLVNDWWNIERLRTLSEVKSSIDAVTIEDIVQYATKHPVAPITLVTLGPQNLELRP